MKISALGLLAFGLDLYYSIFVSLAENGGFTDLLSSLKSDLGLYILVRYRSMPVHRQTAKMPQ